MIWPALAMVHPQSVSIVEIGTMRLKKVCVNIASSTRQSAILGLFMLLFAHCGDDRKVECSPTDPGACGGGQVCEAYTDTSGEHHACFAPTLLRGKISNAQTGGAIANARVIAIDGDSHAAVGAGAITDAMGSYAIRVVPPRMSGGEKQFTLRAGAAGYSDFPGGVRVALPISVSIGDPRATATVTGPTDVELVPMADAPPGSITGKVSGLQPAGVLVVAQAGDRAYSTVSDGNGDFEIFNAAAGTYSITGYFVGINFAPVQNVQVAASRVDGIRLASSGRASGVLTGSLNYVAGANTSTATAVVLRLRATREVPPGLSTHAANATPYRLEGVPDGTYDVLAAFPTDGLVKDPDPGQAGTSTPTATFMDNNTVDVGAFKVTNPVDIVGPDANAKVNGNPTFSWTAYPQTDHYMAEVFDAQGNQIWMLDNIPRSTSLNYSGPALIPGAFYQWRITSFAQSSGAPRPISESEDLRGVWQQGL